MHDVTGVLAYYRQLNLLFLYCDQSRKHFKVLPAQLRRSVVICLRAFLMTIQTVTLETHLFCEPCMIHMAMGLARNYHIFTFLQAMKYFKKDQPELIAMVITG